MAPLTGLPLGCGPSIQPIHEGGVRFEHCYRLDLDAKIAPAHRHACWKQWLEVYSYGQSRDRLEYSQRRLRDLESGDPHPPQLNLDHLEAREARQFYMATPAPTSVHAPPPPVATASTEPLAPGDACVIGCRTARAACLTRCEKPVIDPATAPPPSAEAKTGNPPSTRTPGAKPAPPSAVPPTAATGVAAAGEAAEGAKESTVGECDCEADYKMCGARCFE
ncbi:MAG TPA: hypothetical protein VI197_16440 [Polyangiaceae bacterium]